MLMTLRTFELTALSRLAIGSFLRAPDDNNTNQIFIAKGFTMNECC